MARYIDADEFLKHFSVASSSDDIIEELQEAPTADVVEVEKATMGAIQIVLDAIREYRRSVGDDPVWHMKEENLGRVGNWYLEMLGLEARYGERKEKQDVD